MYVLNFEDLKELESLRKRVLLCKIKPIEKSIIEKFYLPFIDKTYLDKQPKIVNRKIYNIYLKTYTDLKNIYIKKISRPYRQFELTGYTYIVEYFQQLAMKIEIDKVLKLDEIVFLDKLFSYRSVLKKKYYEEILEKRYEWLKSQ